MKVYRFTSAPLICVQSQSELENNLNPSYIANSGDDCFVGGETTVIEIAMAGRFNSEFNCISVRLAIG